MFSGNQNVNIETESTCFTMKMLYLIIYYYYSYYYYYYYYYYHYVVFSLHMILLINYIKIIQISIYKLHYIITLLFATSFKLIYTGFPEHLHCDEFD